MCAARTIVRLRTNVWFANGAPHALNVRAPGAPDCDGECHCISPDREGEPQMDSKSARAR
jgi:hypothetical protein